MSAIYGIFGAANLAEVSQMGSRLAHRGTQSVAWSVSDTMHFGQSFFPIDGEASPPIVETMVFGGFIDNRQAIAALVSRGDLTRQEVSDTKLCFELYQKFGPQGLHYLSGQFGLAIWDAHRQRLILARDSWASCPLYVTKIDGRYLFATEYKALLAIDSVPAQPNRDALQYLHCTKYVRPDACCLAGVYAVPNGAWLELGGNEERTRRYQALTIDVPDRSDAAHAEALRHSLLEAVRRQTHRFDAVGVSLSAGLDSAVTVAAVRHVAPDKPLHTFTAGFGRADGDLAEAMLVAQHFGTSHHEVLLSPDDLPTWVPSTVWHMEDPVGREEKLFYYLIAQEAARHVPLLLSGHNADALFGGMPRHLVVKMVCMMPITAGPLAELYHYTQSGIPAGSLLGKALVNLYYKGKHIPPPRVLGATPIAEGGDFYLPGDQPLSELLRRHMLEHSNPNAAIERLHAPARVTFNSPFLDTDLVHGAFQIPDRLKIHGRRQKYILREACTGLLPKHMLNRKKGLLRLKHDRRFCDVVDELSADLLAPQVVASRRLFDPTYVARIRQRPANGIYASEQIYRLWSLLLTEVWSRIFLDGRGEAPSLLGKV